MKDNKFSGNIPAYLGRRKVIKWKYQEVLNQCKQEHHSLIWPAHFCFKEIDDVVAIGLRIEEKHCNSAGTAHGGLVATMADVALGNSIGHASISDEEREQWREGGYELKRPPVPRVTVNLSTDHAGFAKVGHWVEMNVDIQKLGKSMSFANAY